MISGLSRIERSAMALFHEVLVDNAACADVEVAYFGVAHLPVGEADVFA